MVTDRWRNLTTAFRRRTVLNMGLEPEGMGEVMDLVGDDRLRTMIKSEIALADVAQAVALSRSGRAVGKIVIRVGG